VIDLIAKRPSGLLNALEELSVLNRGQQDEGSLLAAYNSTHASNPLYERPRFGGNTSKLFTVKHYAGPVTYNVTGFLDKNNNALQEDLLTLLMCSSNAFVQNAIVATGMGVPPNAEHVGQPGYVPEVSADRIVQTAGKACDVLVVVSKRVSDVVAASSDGRCAVITLFVYVLNLLCRPRGCRWRRVASWEQSRPQAPYRYAPRLRDDAQPAERPRCGVRYVTRHCDRCVLRGVCVMLCVLYAPTRAAVSVC
jgi:hypothetical protein